MQVPAPGAVARVLYGTLVCVPRRGLTRRWRCRRGFSNVGYNNGPNPEPRTPHIDALHHSGAELTNYYVYRFCSPTRSSFMSGRLPYHVNQQNHPPASPGGGVPLGMTTLADKLNASGYLTHQIGKVGDRFRCRALGQLPRLADPRR